MDESNQSGRSPLTIILLFILVVIVPLAIGIFAAPRLLPKPEIGVIRLNYEIASDTAYEITEQLAYARSDPAIKGVVLVINSPGGSAAYSEELYLDVLETRRQMPVVASVDLLAASGAYYMAAAADEIYAKPTSSVGSIGVIAYLPDNNVFVEEDLLTTGPYKAFGGTRDGVVRQIERAKFAFLQAVETGRGERLNIDTQTLSRAEIYTGVQAMELGLIDGLAANEEVLRRAADLAGLNDYKTVELYPLAFPDTSGQIAPAAAGAPLDVARLWAPPNSLAPGLYYRHVDMSAGNNR
ncbi:MAG: S49 family peptidase [Ardenticatenaceae bacterium]|nr:S49 family peptidase [Ardenticatenaceae bacterium]MCB8987014.1 S49 family peptidase [Ardenticatenaceae bacterium]